MIVEYTALVAWTNLFTVDSVSGKLAIHGVTILVKILYIEQVV